MTDFVIDIKTEVLEDLQSRLARTRRPDHVGAAGDWSRGTAPADLDVLLDRWHHGYDWRVHEARLNQWEHHKDVVAGLDLHWVRAGTRGRPPLLLIHGWPDSFLRFEKLIPLLADDFDLVIPSIPGYGFSGHPTEAGWNSRRVAEQFTELMTTLGLDSFAVHGGDLGSGIAEWMGSLHPDRVTALHLLDIPYWHIFATDPAELTDAEKAYLEAGTRWSRSEGAYAMLQSTKPQTLAAALNDSPAGLAAWVLEKFRAWSDCDGDVWKRFDADTLLTNLTLYWVTGTAGSAARYYYENAVAAFTAPPPDRVEVPTALAAFPADIVTAPEEFAARWTDLKRYTAMPRGGHFAAWEEPELLAEDLRTFLL